MGHGIAEKLSHCHRRRIIGSGPYIVIRKLHPVIISLISGRRILRTDQAPVRMPFMILIIKGLRPLSPASHIIIAYHLQLLQKFFPGRMGLRHDLIIGQGDLSGRIDGFADDL